MARRGQQRGRQRGERSGSSAGGALTDGEGRTVVRAVVHARLLGIRLLSLDAQIVLGPALTTAATDRALYPAVPVMSWSDGATGALPTARTPATSDGALDSAGLARATELLAESGAALSRSRRDAVRKL